VITTQKTCSASEAVIAALRPYVELLTVGSATCGKPVGGRVRSFRDQSYYVISFRAALPGEVAYFHGLAADCPAEDDLRHDLGDPEESSLKVALQALRDGGCSGTAAVVASH
jgi:carboxyl-terminal processing protease